MADEVIADKSFGRADQAIRRGEAAADDLEIIARLLKDGDLRRILLDIFAEARNELPHLLGIGRCLRWL